MKTIKEELEEVLFQIAGRAVEPDERLLNYVENKVRITGETSDGYHTFNELYAYRMAYNALLFNEWFKAGKNDVHWSRKHSTGEDCFGGGWFVVVAQTPSGQITNHYELKDLQWFAAIEERERAAEWDGHTPAEAFDRLRKEAWNFSIPF